MATLTAEQIEQKKQQLKQLAEEVKALTKELVEAGVIEISEEDLEKVAGGYPPHRPEVPDQPWSRPKIEWHRAPDSKPYPQVKS
ncbi:MAG: hypothetical protein IJR07_00225 [Bacteroidaceae bacterium]|nr:hypothetical protein [Bacteroidaceae bacterium]